MGTNGISRRQVRSPEDNWMALYMIGTDFFAVVFRHVKNENKLPHNRTTPIPSYSWVSPLMS